MHDEQLIRYSRHILLPDIDIAGQEKLLSSHALVIGAGGLGSPAGLYLAASGVGTLTICDDDTVDLTNLQRQIIHDTDSVGQAKVDQTGLGLNAAQRRLEFGGASERGGAKARLFQRRREQATDFGLVIENGDQRRISH